MGVGSLRLVDRDIVEEQNLSTQLLYDEEDLRNPVPKVIAAVEHLRNIHSDSRLEACPSDLIPQNAEELLTSADVIIDSTDNFETRFLINDVALKFDIPWIYTGVVGFTGLTMAVVPGKTACLRCFMDEPPPDGELPTCETAGVWAPAAGAIAAIGLTQLLNLIIGKEPDPALSELDLESGVWRKIRRKRKTDCPACGLGKYDFLSGSHNRRMVRICGREMVHIHPAGKRFLNLQKIAESLPEELHADFTDYLLKINAPEAEIYLFPDGRALVKGTSDLARAKAVYQRYISS
jgi:adenylyltransferase/sulfurtransferase